MNNKSIIIIIIIYLQMRKVGEQIEDRFPKRRYVDDGWLQKLLMARIFLVRFVLGEGAIQSLHEFGEELVCSPTKSCLVSGSKQLFDKPGRTWK